MVVSKKKGIVKKKKNIIGNLETKEMHKLSCPWVQIIDENNKCKIGSVRDGLKKGFDGCGHCLAKYSSHNDSDSRLVISLELPNRLEGVYGNPDDRKKVKFKININEKLHRIRLTFVINRKSHSLIVSDKKSGLVMKEKANGNIYSKEERAILKNFILSFKKKSFRKKYKLDLRLADSLYNFIFKILSSPIDYKFKTDVLKRKFGGSKSIKKVGFNLFERYSLNSGNSFLQSRRYPSRAVYRGEIVQARFGIGGIDYYKWIVVGLEPEGNGLKETNIGCAGDPNIGLKGWSYGAVDHDVCQIENRKIIKEKYGWDAPNYVTCLGDCTNEILSAIPGFLYGQTIGWDGSLICENKVTQDRKRNFTTFQFQLLENSHVRMELVDRRSNRSLRVLHDGYLREGAHSVRWNEKINGRIAPVGSYYCRFICKDIDNRRRVPDAVFNSLSQNQKNILANFLVKNNSDIRKSYFKRKVCTLCRGHNSSCWVCGGDGIVGDYFSIPCGICNGKGGYNEIYWYTTGRLGYFLWVKSTLRWIKTRRWPYRKLVGRLGYLRWHKSTLKWIKGKRWKKCFTCGGDGIYEF